MDREKFNDMSPEEFRIYGHKLIDWIADYLKNVEKYPVLPAVKPGELKKKFPESPPEYGQSMNEILNDIDEKIIPGVTHWNHPKFMALFNSTSSGPGILAELLTAALNVNGMIWKTGPIATELEQVTLSWLRQMLELPSKFWGIIYDTASISTVHAIASAKTQIASGIKCKNLAEKLSIYFSGQAHSSVEKGALFLGIKRENIRKIETDDEFRMIPGKLEEEIEKDKKQGLIPFCVIATIGTTSSTSVDPVNEIAKICRENNIWLHVDAAYAGVTAMIPEMRHYFNGIEKADSFVVNPHKWLFMPVDISVFYTSKPRILKKTFSLTPEYLKTGTDSIAVNYMDYGIQLGRRFRSLKLWFVIRYFGKNGLTALLRKHINIAQQFANLIDEHPYFERMAPAPFSTVCFRAKPLSISSDHLNGFNEKLMNRINDTGKAFLSHTKLNGNFVIRLVISGIRTEEKHMLEVWDLLQDTLMELTNEQ